VDYILRARDEVRTLLTPGEADRLVLLAIAAAEATPDWGPGQEHHYEIEEEAYVEEGFELSCFVVRHVGERYEIDFYHGPGSEFVQ
jgi:hypothetical protein